MADVPTYCMLNKGLTYPTFDGSPSNGTEDVLDTLNEEVKYRKCSISHFLFFLFCLTLMVICFPVLL